MRFHVAHELRQPLGSVTTFQLEERSLRLGETTLRGLTGSVHTLRTDRGLLISLRAAATVDECCSRCLAETACQITIEFQEEYLPLFDIMTGARLRQGRSSDAFRIGPDFVLDLHEGLRQYTLTSGPVKPLCKPDCAGLCPTCGADLNRESCQCPPDLDGRWQALASLRPSDEEGS